MTTNEKIKEIESEIEEMQSLISDASVPADEKKFAKEEITELKGKIEMLKKNEAEASDKQDAEKKRLAEKKSKIRTQGGKRIKKRAKKQRRIKKVSFIPKPAKPKKRMPKFSKAVKSFNRGNANIARDRQRLALKPGKRTSAEGNTYYESRKNRADISKAHRLEKGGLYNKGGAMHEHTDSCGCDHK